MQVTAPSLHARAEMSFTNPSEDFLPNATAGDIAGEMRSDLFAVSHQVRTFGELQKAHTAGLVTDAEFVEQADLIAKPARAAIDQAVKGSDLLRPAAMRQHRYNVLDKIPPVQQAVRQAQVAIYDEASRWPAAQEQITWLQQALQEFQ